MAVSGLVISQIQDVMIVTFGNTSILDGPTIEAIARELYALVDEKDKHKIVLDFRPVRLLSSQMLGVLITLLQKAKAIKARFILCGLRPELYRVFKITKLDTLLEFADTEEQALGRFDAFQK